MLICCWFLLLAPGCVCMCVCFGWVLWNVNVACLHGLQNRNCTETLLNIFSLKSLAPHLRLCSGVWKPQQNAVMFLQWYWTTVLKFTLYSLRANKYWGILVFFYLTLPVHLNYPVRVCMHNVLTYRYEQTSVRKSTLTMTNIDLIQQVIRRKVFRPHDVPTLQLKTSASRSFCRIVFQFHLIPLHKSSSIPKLMRIPLIDLQFQSLNNL